MPERAVPILPSRDLSASLRFYEALGFRNVGAPPEEWHYLILARGDLVLHLVLEPAVDPLRTASSCYLYVDDVDALHQRWRSSWPELTSDQRAAGTRLVAPEDTGYAMRELAVVDLDGNLLRAGSPSPGAGGPPG